MNFTDLQAWQEGTKLVQEVYSLTKSFPGDERFGLVSQLRRASTGIVANLAEGFSRMTSADKAYKYTIARGECAEVHALLLISTSLDFVSVEEVNKAIALSVHTGRLLTGLIKKFSALSPSPSPSPTVM